jgi:hypothetical protein
MGRGLRLVLRQVHPRLHYPMVRLDHGDPRQSIDANIVKSAHVFCEVTGAL